jgi:pimeloyl-ACP methyl ester carboxylesterase
VNRLLVEGCALRIVQAVERAGFDRVIPVLHSYSGVLAPHIARRLPGRAAHLVFVATTNPSDGARPPYPLLDRLVMRLQRLGMRLPRFPFRSAMRRAVLTDLEDHVVQWALERITYAEPSALFLERVFYHGMWSIPRTYVQLLRDRAVPLAVQRSAATALRARRLSIDTGHAVMLSRPAELAAVLNQVAGEAAATARRA